jgi:hypothetical protein
MDGLTMMSKAVMTKVVTRWIIFRRATAGT